MPKVERTVQGDAMTVAGKLKVCIGAFGKLTSLRDQWETECDGKKCILQVYEKKSLEEEGRHFTLTVVLFDTGEEVRIYGTTSGGSNEYWGNPYPDVEGELTSVLGTAIGALDDIIM